MDGKLLALYDADRPKWKRQRRRLLGQAGIHYLRYGRFWVIVLTKGEHSAFYRDHGPHVLDIRRTALKFAGYSVRYSYSELEKRYRVFVRWTNRPTGSYEKSVWSLQFGRAWPPATNWRRRSRGACSVFSRMGLCENSLRGSCERLIGGEARPGMPKSRCQSFRSTGALWRFIRPDNPVAGQVKSADRRAPIGTLAALVLVREHDREHRLSAIAGSAVGLELDRLR